MKRKIKEDIDILEELSPLNLVRYFIKNDDIVIVDRDRLCKQYRESDLYYVMNAFYMLPWQDLDNLTIYFEIDSDSVACGTYDIVHKRKMSKRYFSQKSFIYTYTEEELMNLKMSIESA